METRLEQLEKSARALDPDASARALLRDGVVRFSERFLERLPHAPAYVPPGPDDLEFDELPLAEAPIDLDRVLELLERRVLRPGVTTSSGHFAFIPGSGLYASALGDYLADVINRYVGITFPSPGGVRLERKLLRWMADFVGYPDGAAGDLTSGGSIANLIAIVTAREAHDLRAVDFPRAVVYLTEQAHHSVDKALRIAGLKECVHRTIPMDARYHMRPEALEEAVQADRRAGLNPWLVVAAAGTTDTGAVDPLGSIAQIAQGQGLWFHADGAYGAAFALCEPGKQVLRGIERSDSLVLDPHKGLFLPYGSGAVLVRDGQRLLDAHHYAASYMQDEGTLATTEDVSPAESSPELTRPFRGLRLWLPLALTGVAPFRAALEEKMLLARYFYEALQKVDGISLGPYPDLSIVTFRYIPERGDPEAFNRALVNAVQNDGRIFISSTMIDGAFTLRLAVLNVRTHRDTVDLALDVLQEKVQAVLEAG